MDGSGLSPKEGVQVSDVELALVTLVAQDCTDCTDGGKEAEGVFTLLFFFVAIWYILGHGVLLAPVEVFAWFGDYPTAQFLLKHCKN